MDRMRPRRAPDPTSGSRMNSAFRKAVRWRWCVAALALVFVTLNRPECASFSPLWRGLRWNADELLVAENEGLHRLRAPMAGDLIGADGDDLRFESGKTRYEFRKSNRALKDEPAPGFTVTRKSIWLKDESLQTAKAREGTFLLRVRRIAGAPGRMLEGFALLLFALALTPRRWWSIASSKDFLPAVPGPAACSEIDQSLDAVLLWLTVIPGAILLVGYSLSAFGQLGRWQAWAWGGGILVPILAGAAAIFRKMLPQRWPGMPAGLVASIVREARNEFDAAPLRGGLALLLFGALLVVQVAQVTIAVFLAPTNYDSLTYILPRLACYLQQGSLDFFDSNFVAMTVHFKNVTLLQIFAFLACGRMENATQLVALGASWAALIGIFGISRILTGRILPAIGAAAVAGLMTNFVMIAVTPQLDMPLAGFLAISLYFLGRWLRSPGRLLPPVVAAFAFSMALGGKASALLLVPSFGAVIVLKLARSGWRAFRAEGRSWILFAAASIAGVILFVLPSGYVENWRRYGDIMGPERWRRAHVRPPGSAGEFFQEGFRNTARYGIHFLSLDGLPEFPWTVALQRELRESLIAMASFAGMDLQDERAVRQPFAPQVFYTPNEDLSYAGPAFYLLLIPGAFMALRRLPDRGLVATLIAGGMLFFLAQSFLSRYDPWRGRSFVSLSILVAPLVASLFCRDSAAPGRGVCTAGNALLGMACLVVLCTGLNSGFFRYSSPLYARPGTIAFAGSLLGQSDRLWQLCRANPEYLDRHRRFDAQVPDRALVVLCGVHPGSQYPMFGAKLGRHVVYLPAEEDPPAEAYLVFPTGTYASQDGDVALDVLAKVPRPGQRLMLRRP